MKRFSLIIVFLYTVLAQAGVNSTSPLGVARVSGQVPNTRNAFRFTVHLNLFPSTDSENFIAYFKEFQKKHARPGVPEAVFSVQGEVHLSAFQSLKRTPFGMMGNAGGYGHPAFIEGNFLVNGLCRDRVLEEEHLILEEASNDNYLSVREMYRGLVNSLLKNLNEICPIPPEKSLGLSHGAKLLLK